VPLDPRPSAASSCAVRSTSSSSRRGPLSSFDILIGMRGAQLLDARSDDELLSSSMKKKGLRMPGGHSSVRIPKPLPAGGNRPFQGQGFSQADLRFFETLAVNAGVALRSSHLLEQLREQAAAREHQAHHDTLTDLPNWLYFTERLDESAEGAGERRAYVIDWTGSGRVNDTLGHAIGDAILLELAAGSAVPGDQSMWPGSGAMSSPCSSGRRTGSRSRRPASGC